MTTPLGAQDLQVGMWVQFVDNAHEAAGEQKEIYAENQRFFVFTREDSLGDPCCCKLVDILTQQKFEYTSRMSTLGYAFLLPKGKIQAVSQVSVQELHGNEKVEAVFKTVKEQLVLFQSYTQKYKVSTIDQRNLSLEATKQKLNKIIREDGGEHFTGALLVDRLISNND